MNAKILVAAIVGAMLCWIGEFFSMTVCSVFNWPDHGVPGYMLVGLVSFGSIVILAAGWQMFFGHD